MFFVVGLKQSCELFYLFLAMLSNFVDIFGTCSFFGLLISGLFESEIMSVFV